MTTEDERNYVEQARREKRDKLVALGVNPYGYRFERSHVAADAVRLYQDVMGDEGPVVRVAGRVASPTMDCPPTFQKNVASGWVINNWFKSSALTVKSSAGDGNPARIVPAAKASRKVLGSGAHSLASCGMLIMHTVYSRSTGSPIADSMSITSAGPASAAPVEPAKNASYRNLSIL